MCCLSMVLELEVNPLLSDTGFISRYYRFDQILEKQRETKQLKIGDSFTWIALCRAVISSLPIFITGDILYKILIEFFNQLRFKQE